MLLQKIKMHPQGFRNQNPGVSPASGRADRSGVEGRKDSRLAEKSVDSASLIMAETLKDAPLTAPLTQFS
jgi:hypothetical protein